MNISKKCVVLSLATCMTLSPIVANANNHIENAVPISTTIEIAQSEYITFEGKISEINSDGKYFSILVENDLENALNSIVLHISEDVMLLSDKTKDFIDKDALKKGMKISAYYHKDTAMAMSMPPQLGPDAIVVRENDNPVAIKVDKFNKELVSIDNMLKLFPSDDTIIIDEQGNKVEKENLAGKDLMVFYTISTKSIPAQTTPEKIVVVEREKNKIEAKVKVLNKIMINEKEISLNNSLYINEDGTLMIPLRQIAETLEYEVKWNNETRSVELVKGAQWTSVKIGEDNYNFAKMLVKLGTAPKIKDSSTYVPFNFISEIMQLDTEVTKDGVIKINK